MQGLIRRMARQQRTADDFEAIAEQLLESSNVIRAIGATMRDAGMPSALVHATLPENTHLPAIVDWIDKLKVDVRSQLRAFVSGVPSDAERRIKQTENQKLAAAKKPLTPKTARKKVT